MCLEGRSPEAVKLRKDQASSTDENRLIDKRIEAEQYGGYRKIKKIFRVTESVFEEVYNHNKGWRQRDG